MVSDEVPSNHLNPHAKELDEPGERREVSIAHVGNRGGRDWLRLHAKGEPVRTAATSSHALMARQRSALSAP